MGITVSELKNVNTLNISYAAGDFANASSWYSDALDSFVSDVQNPIDSGHAWHDGGQQDAATVMEINRSALGIGEVEMDAASRTLLGLSSALGSAQGYLLTSLFEAHQKSITVHEDGSASYDGPVTTTPYSSYGGGGGLPDADTVSKQNDAKRIEREVKGYLAFANIADTTSKGVLDRIASHTPSYSTTADPSVLSYNESLVDEVLKDRDIAAANQRFWDVAVPKAMPEQPSGWDKFWHGVGNFFSYAWDNPTDVANLVKDAGVSAMGVLVAAAGGTIAVGGGVLDLGVVTIPAGAAVSVAGAGVAVAGGTMAVAGAGQLGVDLAQMNSDAQSSGGSGEPASTTPEPPNVATKPTVQDSKLGNIVNDLYKGTKSDQPVGDGTTADAVRSERITGKPSGPEGRAKWHFGKAGEYIHTLQKWMAEHPDASAADKAVAQQEMENLQNALGPKDAW
ncbi:MAG: hypothetical protein J2P24_02680 [Streptosporangiales bacterium]|nr:hypothetical protein [Streptosporangiales bacterium]MBO0891559.1 hypothetical protein [Acidothermales bacterium]